MTTLTVAEVAAALRVSDESVLALIHAGKLKAANVGLGARRPRWRIRDEDLDDFLAARTAPSRQSATRRRNRPATNVVEFF